MSESTQSQVVTGDRRPRPGGEVNATRDIHFFWILDGSESMKGEKIRHLNYAVANATPALQRIAVANPQIRVFMQAIKFANNAEPMFGEPVPLADFAWRDITATGQTAMGQALAMVADRLGALERDATARYLPACLILVTDGHPTDDFEAGLNRLMSEKYGRSATRLAIAIGNDADEKCLARFIDNPGVPVLHVNDTAKMDELVRLVSSSALTHSSTGGSGPLVWKS
jgi:uncharacterized protein YegL